LSNAGLDDRSMIAFGGAIVAKSKADVPYASFRSAMKLWLRDKLVVNPDDSGLVFEFHVDSAMHLVQMGFAEYSTFLTVSILDTKTHVVLWTVKSPLVVNNRKMDENAGAAVANLLESLKELMPGDGVGAAK
jgi:hypothetical protein